MNQTQRNYLIEKIKAQEKIKVKALRDSIPERPESATYIRRDILKDKFELLPVSKLKDVIKEKLSPNAGKRAFFSGYEDKIELKIKDLFVLPDDFIKAEAEYIKQKQKAEDKIHEIQTATESLITRIQLASDKTLQQMINEVDDMGNISLIHTTLKQLTS